MVPYQELLYPSAYVSLLESECNFWHFVKLFFITVLSMPHLNI